LRFYKGSYPRRRLERIDAIDWEGMKKPNYGNMALKSINKTKGYNAAIDDIKRCLDKLMEELNEN